METNNIVPLSVTISNDDVVVLVSGDATMKISHVLKKFMMDLMDESVGIDRHFKIDLKNCSYMDSTFTGILIILEKHAQKKLHDRFEILNPSPFCVKVLDTMGLIPLFKISKNNGIYNGKPIQLKAMQIQKLEEAILMYLAHKELSDISEENRKEFADVQKYLKEHIEKSTGKNIDKFNINLNDKNYNDSSNNF
jgi:anti-anti-sigma factor